MPSFVYRLRLPIFLLLCLMAVALLMRTPVVAHAGEDDRKPATIEVTAEQTVSVAPDIAVFQAGVVTNADTAGAAMSDNRAKMNAVFDAIKKAGIADKDVQTAGITINPQYKYEENNAPKVTGYQASNTVTVTLRDMAKIGDVIDALVGQGVNQMNGPSFQVDDRDAALAEARTAAVKKARARADAYAAAAGVKIARVFSITEAGDSMPQPYPMARMAMAEAKSATPVATGEVELGVNLRIVYEIAP